MNRRTLAVWASVEDGTVCTVIRKHVVTAFARGRADWQQAGRRSTAMVLWGPGDKRRFTLQMQKSSVSTDSAYM